MTDKIEKQVKLWAHISRYSAMCAAMTASGDKDSLDFYMQNIRDALNQIAEIAKGE